MSAIGRDKLRVSIERHGAGLAVMSFAGELDAITARAYRAECCALVDSGVPHLVADLSELTLLDSAGISLLVSLLKRARQGGGSVRLVQPARSAVRQLLQIARLDLVFESSDSVEGALQSLAL